MQQVAFQLANLITKSFNPFVSSKNKAGLGLLYLLTCFIHQA